MSETMRVSRLSVAMSARDLLNVAIFAVIYFVVVYAIAMLGIISPLVMLLTLPLSIVVAGIPYMLFLTRVRHAGMVALFGTAIAVLYLISGQPLISTFLTVVVSVAAEAILWAGRYRSRWAAIGAYAVFSLWFIGPMLPLALNRAEYLSSPGMQAMGADYVAEFDRTVSATALWLYCLSTVVCGLIGGLLGAAALRKHFTRAGLA
jgi:energy-coupling factor transport system substrate-specific component